MNKRIAFVNVVCNGSTGNIMCNLADKAKDKGFETYCFFGRGNPKQNINCIKIGNKMSVLFHVFLARIGFNGHGSYFATKNFVKKLKMINPDIIHMHNLHGYYLNLKVFFKYLKKEYKGKLIWTLHDCWAFTGHCSHYVEVGCYKWKKCCRSCPQLNKYPKEFFDTTKYEYKLKKKLFSNLERLTLITPSKWLEEQVRNSFLTKYSIKTINNGINLNLFKPINDFDIYKNYNIPKNKKILLGVANVWDEQKGLNKFIEMSKLLTKEEIIVLVGLKTHQLNNLPKNIIGITRTENQKELAKLYSISDIFINPSTEETFSLVTVEAMVCGIPVIVCGLSATRELVDEDVGSIIERYSYKDFYNAYKIIMKKKLNKQNIIKKASAYSLEKMIEENMDLYKEV